EHDRSIRFDDPAIDIEWPSLAGGFQDAETVLKQNLSEEEAMADWLKENLSDVTLRYAKLRAAGETAKS
ncbi:hypothetical protein LB570_25005, partial [Mesorhizobium sp. BR1-1-5]|nr:hypothetical protein [Mesorhizobium sp. BR1-1-5]